MSDAPLSTSSRSAAGPVPAGRPARPVSTRRTVHPAWRLGSAGALALAIATLAACGKGGGDAGHGGMGQMPPPAVGVVTAQPGAVGLTLELPGRLEPLRTAQVRARATGVVLKRLYTEGGLVKAGQSLYQVDAAPYRAALDAALATQAKAEAALAQAQATLERNRPLAEAKAISPQDWVATQAAHKAAVADVAAAKAQVQSTRLNLDYAAVTAPISGRIGRSLVTEGALVSAAEATLMATIQQTDTMMVNFTQSAAEAMRLRQAISGGKLQASGSAQVRLVLDDGRVYGHAGRLLFSDITVDATTGQVTLRAEVPNPQGELLPGLFVKVRVEQARSDQAILLPQQAVTRGTAGDTVLVVGADNQVAPRQIQLGGAHDGATGPQWVVLGGLQAGEKVVVDGFQKIRPKAPVSPLPWSPTSGTAQPGGAAAGPQGAAGPASAPAAPAASTAPATAGASR
ncbi:MAG: hypothetical protein RLY78_1422 [Pseudomonadota bacterium]